MNILTVGDGDLSYSLALKRCYGSAINLTATVLNTELQLRNTYKNAADNLQMLRALDTTNSNTTTNTNNQQFEVDATHLEQTLNNPNVGPSFDLVIFNHPHLDYDSLRVGGDVKFNEGRHIQRHHALLAHYFHSAAKVSSLIHVSLCQNQPVSWDVMRAARNNDLKLVYVSGTESPLLTKVSKLLFKKCLDETPVTNLEWKAPRKYRSGKLGSQHFLSRYGYVHKRTESDKDMRVNGSVDIIFALKDDNRFKDMSCPEEWCLHNNNGEAKSTAFEFLCNVCGETFESKDLLIVHEKNPASPNMKIDWKCDRSGKTFDSAYAMETFQKQRRTSAVYVSEVVSKNKQETCNLPTTKISEDKKMLGSKISTRRIVDSKGSFKRLRAWSRQPDTFGHKLQSKRQCKAVIRQGGIKINGQIVYDEARLLHEGDVIDLIMDEGSSAANELLKYSQAKSGIAALPVVYENDEFLVVFKNPGMRVFGADVRGSLQMTLNAQKESKSSVSYYPISRLETGCAGLCIVAKSKQHFQKHTVLKLTYTFTVLVMGDEDSLRRFDDVQLVELPVESSRFWGKKESNVECWHSERCKASIQRIDSLFLDEGKTLSTLNVSSFGRNGRLSSSICFFLRKSLKCAVVGDSYCSNELASLPRCFRTRLKGKMQIGCYYLVKEMPADESDLVVSTHVPDKLLASKWTKYLHDDGE